MKKLKNFVMEEKTPVVLQSDRKVSRSKWETEPKTDNTAANVADPEDVSEAEEIVDFRFSTEQPFMLIGEAGWAKTSMIKNAAKRYGYIVKTVYLSSCMPEDVEGQPLPIEIERKINKGADKDDEKIKTATIRALPKWAREIYENPDKDYFVFFDEMNQADVRVQNVIMHIVLEKTVADIELPNMFCAAAGNHGWENTSIEKLTVPMRERLKPIIYIEPSEEQWKRTVNFWHGKWDKLIGADFINEIDKYKEYFLNPRNLEHNIIVTVYRSIVRKREGQRTVPAKTFYAYLKALVTKVDEDDMKIELSREEDNAMKRLADYIANYIENDGKSNEKETGGRSRKNKEMLSETTINNFKAAMTRGWIQDNREDAPDKRKFGVSRENIAGIFEDIMNPEQAERLIRKLEADNCKFRYEKNSEWKKAGFADPDED